MVDLAENVVIYVDHEEHRLVKTVLEDNDLVHEEYEYYHLVKKKIRKTRRSPRGLWKLSSGDDRPRR